MGKFRSEQRISQNNFDRTRIDRPVLIVEDSKLLAQVTASILETRWGCQSHIAGTLAEAKKFIEKYADYYVAAICDLNLPDAPHGEALDLINRTGVPIIAMSGVFGDDLRDMVVKKGVADYVLKEGRNTYEYIVNIVGRLFKNRNIQTLIIDDSISARAVLKHMLVTQCLNPLIANNGNEGLQLLDAHPGIRLVIVDYNMPEMDGFQFTLEARKKFGKERLVIIGVSASADGNVAAKFLKFGANDFIFRPFSYEELFCRVTQNLEMLEQLETISEAASRDYMTGLYNRRHLFEQGRKIYADAKKCDTPLSLAIVDIDHFKKINDEFGHSCGDEVLKHFARFLDAHFGEALVARLGGEEFAILSEGGDHAKFRARCEEFVRVVKDSPAMNDNQPIRFTISIGLNDAMMENLDAMMKIADDNLYQAKAAGRNQLAYKPECSEA
jgi:diguanylate cyclase (GGDEF)-like protein